MDESVRRAHRSKSPFTDEQETRRPARSPDQSPLDYWFWSIVLTVLRKRPPHTLTERNRNWKKPIRNWKKPWTCSLNPLMKMKQLMRCDMSARGLTPACATGEDALKAPYRIPVWCVPYKCDCCCWLKMLIGQIKWTSTFVFRYRSETVSQKYIDFRTLFLLLCFVSKYWYFPRKPYIFINVPKFSTYYVKKK